MALIFDSDAYSRKSHRHSGRRRTTTSYDKYGYQITTVGSSPFSTESGVHVLRVKPGVVVNFIDAPSSSSRNRSSRSSHHIVEYKSNRDRKSSHSHHHDNGRDPAWATTYSPHPRAMELYDDGGVPQPFIMDEAGIPPREMLPVVRHSPPSHHSSPDVHYPMEHRSSHEVHYPVEHRSISEVHYPVEHHTNPEMHYPIEHHSNPDMRYPAEHRSSPEMHYAAEHHSTPQMHHPIEPRNSPRHMSAPIDIPMHSHSSNSSLPLTSTASSSSDSGARSYSHETESSYFAPRHPQVPIEISSPGSHSFGYPSPRMSSSSSPPSHGRTVRFNDNPVLPSPGPIVRRKGWWNKRGDQLWDNDGAYKAAPEHEKYPLDLQNHPEPGTGWMNEEGVLIDTKRRLIRKRPLRSALKKTSSL